MRFFSLYNEKENLLVLLHTILHQMATYYGQKEKQNQSELRLD